VRRGCDLGQECLRIGQLIQHEGQQRLVGALFRQLGWNAPQLGEAAVDGGPPPLRSTTRMPSAVELSAACRREIAWAMSVSIFLRG